MPPALKAAFHRGRGLLLVVLAGGVAGLGGAAPAAVDPGAPTVTAAEIAAWSEAQRVRSPEAYQRYLELFPIGAHAEEAFRLLVERSFPRRPVLRLVDVQPPLAPGGVERTRVVAAADLALY